jgi:16S rRNA (adenine1518-N6/adenine1519-N6)-dimethyltransferase
MAPQSVHHFLKKHGIRPKKRLGQHFLSAMPTIEKIVGAVHPSPDDCILEIGPGPGLMTALLAERAAHVIAIDKDESLMALAREEFSHLRNIHWVVSDILKADIPSLLSALDLQPLTLKVVGNLPYNISSPILFWLLKGRGRISRATVMLQKEVAMRIIASPGCKDYGILSVQIQAFAKAKRLFDVSPQNFLPPPKVLSSVIEIDFASATPAVAPGDEDSFRHLVRAAFGKRRKTLRNALIGGRLGVTPDAIDAALAKEGIDGKRRPETLSVREFATLAASLKRP